MGTLSPFYTPLPLNSFPLRPSNSSATIHFCKPISWPPITSDILNPTTRKRSKTVARGDPNGESQFLDENGAVDDMDGYLNYLSLEYDSVWDTKPSWCQPWTITLTGVSAIALSWLILHSVVVTTIVSLLIITWWYIFLYSYPKAYTEMIAERRRRVTNGTEDTFGANKSQ